MADNIRDWGGESRRAMLGWLFTVNISGLLQSPIIILTIKSMEFNIPQMDHGLAPAHTISVDLNKAARTPRAEF
jgi:hypothetical protein